MIDFKIYTKFLKFDFTIYLDGNNLMSYYTQFIIQSNHMKSAKDLSNEV